MERLGGVQQEGLPRPSCPPCTVQRRRSPSRKRRAASRVSTELWRRRATLPPLTGYIAFTDGSGALRPAAQGAACRAALSGARAGRVACRRVRGATLADGSCACTCCGEPAARLQRRPAGLGLQLGLGRKGGATRLLRRLKSSKKHEKRVPGRWVGAPKARLAGLRRRATKKSGRKGLGAAREF